MQIKILHLNIEKDKHLDAVENFIKLHNPDIICLCEIYENDAKHLAGIDKYHYFHAPLVTTEKGTIGSVILSKLSVIESRNYRYDERISYELPFVDINHKNLTKNREKERFSYHYSILTVVVENEEKEKITISTTHFPVTDHTTPGLDNNSFDETSDLQEINYTRKYFDNFLKIIKTLPSPLIFTADMNNGRGKYIYDELAHELIDLTPTDITSTLDPVLHREKKLSLVVDTIMITPSIKVNSVNIFDGVSDHKALIANLEI